MNFRITFFSFIFLTLSYNLFAQSLPNITKDDLEYRSSKPIKLDNYIMSPMSKYLSEKEYYSAVPDALTANRRSEIMEGKVITINTKNAEACEAARLRFKLGNDICAYNANSPFVSVVVMKPIENREEFEANINFSNLSDKTKTSLVSLFDYSIMGAGTMGIIYSLPESVSKWDKSRGFAVMSSRWKERVKAGPRIDDDSWAINYIGHPLSGAYYYTIVRHQGFSALESAGFTFCMSTFFWEYGLEALSEIPSVQDLILTPLVGSVLGEIFFSWGNSIERNGGKVLGSKVLGSTASVLLNPAGAFANKFNKLVDRKVIRDIELSVVNKTSSSSRVIPGATDISGTGKKSYLGVQLRLKF